MDEFELIVPHKNVIADCARFNAESDEDLYLCNASVTISSRASVNDALKTYNPIFVIANYLFDRYLLLSKRSSIHI